MKRVFIGCLTVLAVAAFAATPVYASRFLVGGVVVTEGMRFEDEGKLLFSKAAERGGAVLEKVECSYYETGTFGSPTLTWINDLLNLSLATIGEKLSGEELNCTVLSEAGALTDCKENTLADVWVIGLALGVKSEWHGELTLVGAAYRYAFPLELNTLEAVTGIEVECESLIGVKGSEECTGGEPVEEEVNDTEVSPVGVKGEFIKGKEKELENCSMTGEQTGEFEGSSVMWADKGETEERVETTLSE